MTPTRARSGYDAALRAHAAQLARTLGLGAARLLADTRAASDPTADSRAFWRDVARALEDVPTDA